MPRRIISAISRMVGDNWTPVPGADVHFHSGTDGRPYVCGNERCTSPGLDVDTG
jgi:hypothetical protein